ncbi:MAG: nickel pincer cofactor biosynthesis protein LarC [Verrucomicrobia bacterium]|nr:nickel pincer cofactor biosynthesis protein LarC [Verrucomicrobiota bacterium]
MNHLRFDSIGGASGDMILASLIDAGVKADDLRRPLASLNIGEFSLKVSRVTRDGHAATCVRVDIPGAHTHAKRPHARHAHTHDHEHDHQHDHGHAPHDHDHAHHHHHPHRTLRTIRGILRKSKLPARVKALSLDVFQRLAEAEGRVHRMPPDDVHFHEVGAVDSIVDIVGGCLALDILGIEVVSVGALPMGTGTIHCQHGVMPNPAPATAELLKGHPLIQTDEPHELVTPTGAALLMSWQAMSTTKPPPACRITRIGTAFGTRTLHARPNMLRALLMESTPAASATHDTCLVLECNLDDMNPEWIGALTHRLLAAGALDVFTTATQMKKQRPGTMLTVLSQPSDRETLLDLMFRESTSFGIREYLTQRTMLERRHVSVKTRYGSIRIKEGIWKGRVVTRAPEHDDCAVAAKKHNLPLRVIYAAATKA